MSSFTAWSASEAVKRLHCHDPALSYIDLKHCDCADEDFNELADCLLARPDALSEVDVSLNFLADETGIKLARYLAASSTIYTLRMRNNQFGEATYLALAAALRVNSSLRILNLNDNQEMDRTRIDAAFIEALRLNPNRTVESVWQLYTFGNNDFERLKTEAEQLGHPSLQLLLAARLLADDQLAATQL